MELTHTGAKRAIDYWEIAYGRSHIANRYNDSDSNKHKPHFGIVQGSNYKDLREESVKIIWNLLFDGIAVGGVSVGKVKNICIMQ